MLAVVGAGCGAYESQYVVPRTPEGMSCYRECKSLDYQCRHDRGGLIGRSQCNDAWDDCLSTCPGAEKAQ